MVDGGVGSNGAGFCLGSEGGEPDVSGSVLSA